MLQRISWKGRRPRPGNQLVYLCSPNKKWRGLALNILERQEKTYTWATYTLNTACLYGLFGNNIWISNESKKTQVILHPVSLRLEKAMAPHSNTLAWKIPWMEEPGKLRSMGRWGSDTTEQPHFHALEKEMAAHSSILAWRIPGTGEPGELTSMGSHRVGQDWSDLAAAAAWVLDAS